MVARRQLSATKSSTENTGQSERQSARRSRRQVTLKFPAVFQPQAEFEFFAGHTLRKAQFYRGRPSIPRDRDRSQRIRNLWRVSGLNQLENRAQSFIRNVPRFSRV